MKSKAMDFQKKVKDFLKLEKILEKQPKHNPKNPISEVICRKSECA